MIFILLLLAISGANTAPNPSLNKCFTGGFLVQRREMNHGIADFCVRDDISMIKGTSDQVKNQSKFVNVIHRLWNVKNWHKCNPVETSGGTFTVYDVDQTMALVPKSFSCRAECHITVDKEEGTIILSSESLNHYSVSGSSTQSGWFKTKTSIQLSQTCEHIVVSCGKVQKPIHACFKTHMSCVRVLHKTMLPGQMAISICSNIEIILLTTFSIITYLLLWILSGTYIIYILLPIFWPIAYIVGLLYTKACKSCSTCGKPYHPFTSCGTECICGAEFGSTDRLKAHRQGRLCHGFKAGATARALCRNKGSNLILSVMLAIIFFSFLTPVKGQGLAEEEKYSLTEIGEILESIGYCRCSPYLTIPDIMALISNVIALALLLTIPYIIGKMYYYKIYNCHECQMYHYRSGLKVWGDFTNKCETCVCGFVSTPYEDVDYSPPIRDMHKKTENCLYQFDRKTIKSIILSVIVMIAFSSSMVVAEPDPTCMSKPIDVNLSDIIGCYGSALVFNECSSHYIPNKENIYNEFVQKGYAHKTDVKIFDLLDDNFNSAMTKIELNDNKHYQILGEAIIYQRYCDYHKLLNQVSEYPSVGFKSFLQLHHLNLCAHYPYKAICGCIGKSGSCKWTDDDLLGTTTTFYRNDNTSWSEDMNTILQAISYAYRGSATSMMATMINDWNIETLVEFLSNMTLRSPRNIFLTGLVKFAKFLVNLNITTPSVSSYWEHLQLGTRRTRSSQTTMTITISGTTKAKKECESAKLIQCRSKVGQAISVEMVKCGSNNEYYQVPSEGVVHSSDEKWCRGDTHCHKDFDPITDTSAANGLKCSESMYLKLNTQWKKEIQTCQLLNRGVCTVLGHEWVISHCNNEHYYASDAGAKHSGTNNITEYCLATGCKSSRRPIHPSFISNCKWDNQLQNVMHSTSILYADIDSFKHSLESSIEGDLNMHLFKPMSNIPKIKPKYEAFTIQGVETDEGIRDSFVSGEMAAIAGMANGFKIYTKDGQELFDIILYLKTAEYHAEYKEIYKTGPTTTINVRHSEHCTGSCSQEIPAPKGWMTFSKEHTSSWGCEEFGCLAIGTGCLFGSCQDVIKPEATVYKKIGEDTTFLDLCITLPHATFCSKLDILEPTITEKFELVFENTQVSVLPERILVRNNKVYTGQINDLGTFGKYCGNVQQINRTVIGQGVPKFDYICHAAQRKDVVVRKCFDNNYISCLHLENDPNLLMVNNGSKLDLHIFGKKLGTMRYKVKLGDLNYKLYKQEISIDGTGKCAGNVLSANGIMCQLDIEVSFESVCRLTSNCDSFHSTLLVLPTEKKYNLKLVCPSTSKKIEVQVCGHDIPIESTLVAKNEVLDLAPVDQTHYVNEEDLRCTTWICKVKEEGISFIFKPFFDMLGHYTWIFIAVVIIFVIMLLSYYLIIPICGRIRDHLKLQQKLDRKAIKDK
ncbi:polyprotein [Matruh virus]|uniref:Envelopment polyprotein n=1 Tax=Matruh virus TaxID=1678229 RepID=A0A0R7FK92_9VIRU|nr:polyprotein [Matruh virus]AKO90184.1 polyprotein [Matruh virus]